MTTTENGRAVTKSVTARMADKFHMEPAAFQQTIIATVFPNGKATREQFAAVMVVADQYGLNPLTKEIYAFPSQGGGIVPVVGVDGWARIINGHPMFDGMDFEDRLDDKGQLVAVTCRIYRKDRRHATEATEYMVECARGTGPWKSHPRRMLRHKALIQAARLAFSFAGIYDPDEAERLRDAEARVVTVESAATSMDELADALEARNVDAGTMDPDDADAGARDDDDTSWMGEAQ